MKVSRIRALRGPNLWSRHTAIEAIVSCNEAESLTDECSRFFRTAAGPVSANLTCA